MPQERDAVCCMEAAVPWAMTNVWEEEVLAPCVKPEQGPA